MSSDAATPSFIPLCVPEIRGNEWKYVKDCLDTTWVSSVGAYVDRFEQMLAQRAGTRHAVAAVNGTSALHIALQIAGVQANDEVLVSNLTFIAPVNAIRYLNAWPVLMDADPVYWQMDVEKVREFLTRECRHDGGGVTNKTTGRRVKAIVPVHVLGHPVDLDPLLELARAYGLVVIEDATESLGAKYKQRPVGSIGDASAFSFNGNKLITTGGGGMLATDREAWAAKAKYLTTQAKDDAVEFVHGEIGYNYRLTNLQAAMGCAQVEMLDEFMAAKRRIAATYDAALAAVPGITPMRQAPWATSVWWMYTVRIDPQRFGISSREMLARFSAEKIQTRPLWQPMHRSPAHRGVQAYRCEVSDVLYAECLSLPCSVGLTAEQQQRVIAVLRNQVP